MSNRVITEPGVYDIPAGVYHPDPCFRPSLSSSIGKLLISPGSTPRHAWTAHPRLNPNHETKESERFDVGSAAHSLILGDPQQFEIVDASDWRSKAAQAARDTARAAGKIPLLAEQWERVLGMAIAARSQLSAHHDAFDAFTKGKPEQTLIWREDDVWCRARLDWLPDTRRIFDDYKSTDGSADPDVWSRTMFNLGFDFQSAFYTRGIRALGLCERPVFRFIVQEQNPPYALSVVGLMPGAIELAERDVENAIRKWRECTTRNNWPGYPKRTCYVDVPPWREAQKMEREHRESELSAADKQRATEAQAPL